MSIGAGGIRPCSLAFGADQFNEADTLKKEKILETFFNWYYVSVGVAVMLAVTVMVYIQNKAGWAVGFGVPVVLMLVSTITFLSGSPLYIKAKAKSSLLTGFAQVIVAAWKNKHLAMPPQKSDDWYYHKGSELIAPTDKLRFLNKACIIRNHGKDLDSDGLALDPWRLCTITQVEELKALIKTMTRHISKLTIPAASLTAFGILSMAATVITYVQVIIPLLSKFTKRKRGLSLKERMGIGLTLSCLGTAVSAMVERKSRNTAIQEGLSDSPLAHVNVSVMWLVPQHCINGMAEAFNAIGQIEFYYSEFPKSMSSIAMSLMSLGMGVGSLLGGLIVSIVKHVTGRGESENWLSENINKGHYDYYYWLLTILGVVNVFY
uniref:Uncharacterized protein n=1 Tax=Fagus sylvatica TaxID=28930 RepID=A0A2N9H1V2_FAGSY